MMDYARPADGEMTERAVVTVVFLRMTKPPLRPDAVLPKGASLTRERLDVAAYRALYNEIGAPWLWWLRRMMPDDMLARHLASPTVSVSVLRVQGEVAGFYETDAGYWPFVNLNYFGLRQGFMGQGLGRLLLDAAVDSVFCGAVGLGGMTVNTCTADHPRALPNYLAAGFREYRRAREEWDIPVRLGLTVPAHVKA
ncbi:GNAT family N-acetyltransferase [Acidocella sp.]|nr:GNAT family N-acetyltransferase [Acidocella sp.]